MVPTTFTIYLVLSIAITVWVGQTLFRNGRIFLNDAFHGNQEMADSVNNMFNFAKMRKKGRRHGTEVGKPEAGGRGW